MELIKSKRTFLSLSKKILERKSKTKNHKVGTQINSHKLIKISQLHKRKLDGKRTHCLKAN